MKKIWIPLFVGVSMLLAVTIRLWDLATLPAILNRDEAALAYNAVLLAETGRDEWGRVWPITFESFGDYKLPGYIYILAGLFQVLDQSDLVVRLPAALAGAALVITTFWWARSLFKKPGWAVGAAGLLAVTPICLFFSRMAFEAMLGLWLFATGWWLVWFAKKLPLTLLGSLLVIAAFFTYNTPLLLFWPLAIITMWWQWPHFSQQKWLGVGSLVLGWILAAILLLPATQQKTGITIFSDPTLRAEYSQYRSSYTGLAQKLIGNQYVYVAGQVTTRLLASFSPGFLVEVGGTHPWHQLPTRAHLTWMTYILGLVGILVCLYTQLRSWLEKWCVRNVLRLSSSGWLLVSLIIGVLPASITVDAPHATRSLWFFVMWILLAVYGLGSISVWFRQRVGGRADWFVGVFVCILMLEHAQYLWQYFNAYPSQQNALKPGFDQVIMPNPTGSEPVVIIDPDGYHYILAAWYAQIPPQVFLNTIQRSPKDTIGFSYGQQVEGYVFQKELSSATSSAVIRWDEMQQQWRRE